MELAQVHTVEPIRILLAGPESSAIAKVREAVTRQSDMTVVNRITRQGFDMLVAIRSVRPDLLVIEMDDDQLPGVYSHVFGVDPHIAILGLTRNGQEARLYHLQVQSRAVSICSPDKLIDVIRAATRCNLA